MNGGGTKGLSTPTEVSRATSSISRINEQEIGVEEHHKIDKRHSNNDLIEMSIFPSPFSQKKSFLGLATSSPPVSVENGNFTLPTSLSDRSPGRLGISSSFSSSTPLTALPHASTSREAYIERDHRTIPRQKSPYTQEAIKEELLPPSLVPMPQHSHSLRSPLSVSHPMSPPSKLLPVADLPLASPRLLPTHCLTLLNRERNADGVGVSTQEKGKGSNSTAKTRAESKNGFAYELSCLCYEIRKEKLFCGANCYKHIRHTDRIWTCPKCRGIFHLHCVRQWSKSTNALRFPCPLCRNPCDSCTKYTCFCGKVKCPPPFSASSCSIPSLAVVERSVRTILKEEAEKGKERVQLNHEAKERRGVNSNCLNETETSSSGALWKTMKKDKKGGNGSEKTRNFSNCGRRRLNSFSSSSSRKSTRCGSEDHHSERRREDFSSLSCSTAGSLSSLLTTIPTALSNTLLAPHCCTQPCSRTDRPHCSHPCPLPCHPGPCPPCMVRPIYQVLSCACGATTTARLSLPLPCGTPPPLCSLPCRRPRPCGHPYGRKHHHLCHFGACPSCLFCKQVERIRKARLRTAECKRKVSTLGLSWREVLRYRSPPSSLITFFVILLNRFLNVEKAVKSWKDITNYLRQNDIVQEIMGFSTNKESDYTQMILRMTELTFAKLQVLSWVVDQISKPIGVIGKWVESVIGLWNVKIGLVQMYEMDQENTKMEEENMKNTAQIWREGGGII